MLLEYVGIFIYIRNWINELKIITNQLMISKININLNQRKSGQKYFKIYLNRIILFKMYR